MSSCYRASGLACVCVAIFSLGTVGSSLAQDKIGIITSTFASGDQSITVDDSSVSGDLKTGTYKAPAGTQLMATLGKGDAVDGIFFVEGPAEFALIAERGGLTFAVNSGRITLSIASAASAKFAVSVGTINKLRCDSVSPGAIVSVRVDAQASYISFDSGPLGAGLAVFAAEKPESLGVGEALSVEGGASKRTAAEPYRPVVAQRLSVARVNSLRKAVDDSLFDEIVGWDRFAGADEVKNNLPASRTTPEVRQVAVTVSSVNVVPSRGGVTRPEGTIGANQVPIISPASLVVQAGESGAFIVISNNAAAAANLTLTGSQGIGFGTLSIQGLIGGFRFVGPAGLGGR